MKLKMVVVALVAASAAMPGASAAADGSENGLLVLEAGTAIELMVLREVDSDRAKPGDPVRLRVNSPVTVDGTVVVPVGAAAHGEVTAARSSGGMLRRGNISVDITSITLGNQAIPLGTMLDQAARGGKSDDFVKLAMAPMWILFARGNSARLKAGELVSAQVVERVCFEAHEGGHRVVSCPEDEVATSPAASGV
jgi:hypothetical protein